MSGDACSLGSEYTRGDYRSIPEGMTEEQSMDIWLRRNREIEEERLRELQHQQQPHVAGDSPPPHEVRAQQQMRTPSPMSDGGGGGGQQQQPAVADPQQTDAWNAALARNPMGAYDPAEHDAWMAMQRYELASRPEVRDAYVPSTSGMAMLMEAARREDRRNVGREASGGDRGRGESPDSYASQSQIDQPEGPGRNSTTSQAGDSHQMSTEAVDDAIAAQQQAFDALHASSEPQHDDPRVPLGYVPRHDFANRNYHTGGAPAPRDEVLAVQQREYERLTQAHRKQQRSPSPDAPSPESGKPSGHSQGSSKKSSQDDGNMNLFHVATRRPTTENSKSVTCRHCKRGLYTAPLAQYFYCQTCCKVNHFSARESAVETRWEEKMQEMEDCEEKVHREERVQEMEDCEGAAAGGGQTGMYPYYGW
ncbi:hypothetical protein ACHAXT_011108 [Thalassiosira profunda]